MAQQALSRHPWNGTSLGLHRSGLMATFAGCVISLGCSAEPSCTDTLTCSEQGEGGHSSGGASNLAGSGARSSASSIAQGGSAGTPSGSGGATSTADCPFICPAEAPICDASTKTCVGCIRDADCPSSAGHCMSDRGQCVECTSSEHCGASASHCDVDLGSCRQCLASRDCSDPSKPLCVAGTCSPCVTDSDCSGQVGRGVCDTGTCVECTPANELPCGSYSCEPTTRRCSAVLRSSRSDCEPCSADSQCKGYTPGSSQCLPMNTTGYYCLPIREKQEACPRPYGAKDTHLYSASKTSIDYFCSPNTELTSCEAVRDYVNGVPCTKDADCGCTRDVAGACIGLGVLGRCALTVGSTKYCSYACATSFDCPTGRSCGLGAEAYCH
jgi:hypothetical protein